jgi:protein-S-isoprenylcysteine O-methyltransferase Ste14
MSHARQNSRFLVPPVYFLVALVLMVFLHRILPWAQVLEAPYRDAGIIIAGISLGLGAWAAALFRRAGTNIRPFMPSTALVVAGPYRFTRNPMYLGMSGVLLGAAVFMGSLTPFVVIPAFMALIAERFIIPEESKLEAAFGRDYLDYKARVRRWL